MEKRTKDQREIFWTGLSLVLLTLVVNLLVLFGLIDLSDSIFTLSLVLRFLFGYLFGYWVGKTAETYGRSYPFWGFMTFLFPGVLMIIFGSIESHRSSSKGIKSNLYSKEFQSISSKLRQLENNISSLSRKLVLVNESYEKGLLNEDEVQSKRMEINSTIRSEKETFNYMSQRRTAINNLRTELNELNNLVGKGIIDDVRFKEKSEGLINQAIITQENNLD